MNTLIYNILHDFSLDDYSAEQIAVARKEIAWCRENGIRMLCKDDADYPQRLLVCKDAPDVLFVSGGVNLNARHIISVVGTRRISVYGKDVCQRLGEELKQYLPDSLVISGLAYGVDINVHQSALINGVATAGVVAHGLDRIYPSAHSRVAEEMKAHGGGVISEYTSGVEPQRGMFVRRNRIVAALSDVCIVVESAQEGGSLITAGLAKKYGRCLMACPGRITDATSVGCNQLIAEGKALPFLNVPQLIDVMAWEKPQQLSLFTEEDNHDDLSALDADEQTLLQALEGLDGLNANQLAATTGMPVFQISALMLNLEMQGYVETLPGGRFRRLR